jgi:hypothetical protein
MSYGYDPEAIYQDADIEAMELAEAANDPDRLDPWKICGWCGSGNQSATGELAIFDGFRTYQAPHCATHRANAVEERNFYRERERERKGW